MKIETFYDVLGVTRDATKGHIKRAYRRISAETHPDKNPDPTAHEIFRRATVAYKILSHQAKRAIYDQEINQQLTDRPHEMAHLLWGCYLATIKEKTNES